MPDNATADRRHHADLDAGQPWRAGRIAISRIELETRLDRP